MLLPTPLYNLNNFPDVYEPAEDSHLFLDALEKESDFLLSLKPTLACEVGCGSGILITALTSILKNTCSYFGIDINPSACSATRLTSVLNKATVECLQMDLTTCLNQKFDLLIFNPPYVLTEENEIEGCGLNRAYAGGCKGRTITDTFLKSLPHIMTKFGVCYVLLLKENDVEEVSRKMREIGIKSELVIERKIPGEHLYIYKFMYII